MRKRRDGIPRVLFLFLIAVCAACGMIRCASLGFAPRIEPVSCRLAGNGEFIDVRVRFQGKEPFDPDQPGIFLVEESTGEKFYRMQLQRIGKVDIGSRPGEKTVHSIIFKNRDGLLKPGARVTLVIGKDRKKRLLLEE